MIYDNNRVDPEKIILGILVKELLMYLYTVYVTLGKEPKTKTSRPGLRHSGPVKL